MKNPVTRKLACLFWLWSVASWAARPIVFEPNRGQTEAGVQFLAHGQAGSMLLARDGAVLRFRGGARVALRPVNSNPHAELAGEEAPGGVSHYLLGRDRSRWIRDVPQFLRVRYRDIYAGIDQVFYGAEDWLEYDLIVRPGADPRRIRLRVEGAQRMWIDWAGDLQIQAGGVRVVERRPVAYQESGGRRLPVAGRFALAGNEIRFVVGRYDRGLPLVIDPAVRFAGLLGGTSRDLATSVAVDGAGSAYVAGYTVSADFPVTANALQIKQAGVANNGFSVFEDVFDGFVAKYSPDGSHLIYSTFLGGTGSDQVLALRVDAAGNAVVGGFTSSKDFPLAKGAIQGVYPGTSGVAGFISKLNAAGSDLLFSSYLFGSGSVTALALDATGNVYVTGYTSATDVPVTKGAVQVAPGGNTDAFAAKLNAQGTTLVYATYLGGQRADQGWGIAVDAAGNAYIAGGTSSADFPAPAGQAAAVKGFSDSFVCKLNAAGSAVLYTTLLGGSQEDQAAAIALDKDNSAVIAGTTDSPDFATTTGAFQTAPLGNGTTSFVARLDPSGAVAYATLLGGSKIDTATSVAVMADGSAVVAGTTQSTDFPVTADAYQRSAPLGVGCGTFSLMFVTYDAACTDAFLTVVHVSGRRLVYSTFLGGAASDTASGLALGADGALYVTGSTGSDDFPVTTGAFRTARSGGTCSRFASPTASGTSPCEDAYVIKIDPNAVGAPRPVATIVNAVNAVGGPVAPGEFVSLFGFGIGPVQEGRGEIGTDGKLSTTISGTIVTFDGVAAPLLYAGPNQINAIVPYAVAGKTTTRVRIATKAYSSEVALIRVGTANPGLISLSGTGQFQAAALNQDGSLNGNPAVGTCFPPGCGPAARGSIIVLFGDGAGQMVPPGVEGAFAEGPSQTVAPVTVTIGGIPAVVAYAGAAPRLLHGVLQVNAVIPMNVTPGPQVPVFITIAGVTSQPYIGIAVQ